MLEVEPDILSGMPNPTWTLSKRQEATLFELLSAEPRQILAEPDHARLNLAPDQVGIDAARRASSRFTAAFTVHSRCAVGAMRAGVMPSRSCAQAMRAHWMKKIERAITQ